MWKLLAFPSLSALLMDFVAVYNNLHHSVTKVRIGLPVPHNEKLACQVLHRPSAKLCSLHELQYMQYMRVTPCCLRTACVAGS